MHPLQLTFAFWSSFVLSAYGLSVEIPITTTNLDQNKYRFSVSTNAATDGVAFHVIVTAKKEAIHGDSTANLSIVTHTKTPDGSARSIENVKPEIQVAIKKEKRVWDAHFTVSYDLLAEPGLCFIFTELAHANIDGKIVAMPSADFYVIKLRDFLKQ